jgi:hypothetical protein
LRKNDHLVEDALKLQQKMPCVANTRRLAAFLLAGEKRVSWHQRLADVLQA